MNQGPEITITITTTNFQEDDHQRWQTEDAPCFPRPLCVACPPKRPDRKTTGGDQLIQHDICALPHTPAKAVTKVGASSPPRIPRRRVTLVPQEEAPSPLLPEEPPILPPQQPFRQQTEVSSDSDFLSSARSSTWDSTIATSTIDEDLSEEQEDVQSLSNRFDDSLRFEDAIKGEEGSSRDLSPSRPVRQKSVGLLSLSAHKSLPVRVASDGGAQQRQPSWVKMWKSQGGGGEGSFSRLWKFE